jgi:type IV pilus assembly protein PilN
MRHINLLPWREEQRRQQQRRFYRHTLAVAGLAVVLVVAAAMELQGMVRTQQHRNDYLRQQIALIDGQIGEVQGLRSERKRMSERLVMVESLQGSRIELVHILDALPRTVPEGVVLEELKQTGDALEISGVGHSNADISQFMRKLDESPWFHSARLSVVNAGSHADDHDSHFVLEVGTRRPEAGR